MVTAPPKPNDALLSLGFEVAAELTFEDAGDDDDGLPTLRGVAVRFNTPSRSQYGTRYVIRPSAQIGFEDDTFALYSHDWGQVLGRTSRETLAVSVSKDGIGFALQPPPTTFGRDLVTQIRRGDIDGVSLGVRVNKARSNDDADGRLVELQDITVRELSLTPIPAFPGTDVRASAIDGIQSPIAEYRAEIEEMRKCLK